MKMLAILLSFLVTSWAQAQLIQIVHTNDLHSYYRGTSDGHGGYARIKTIIDQLKAQAAQKGIETIVLDAGDWGDGTSYFLSDRGADSVRALQQLGIDASCVGNHDFMLGTQTLLDQVRRAGVSTKILTANLKFTEPQAEQTIPSNAFFDRAGMHIEVIGLTTDDPTFQGPLAAQRGRPKGGSIDFPQDAANLWSDSQHNDGAKLIIALTHLGVGPDKDLAKNTSNIDVIVGGHSHTRLSHPIFETNQNGRRVPIVQTGADGYAVGSLILNVKRRHKVKVVSYKLYNVNSHVSEDPVVADFVNQAEQRRNDFLGGHFNDSVGLSNINLTGYVRGNPVLRQTCWSKHKARMVHLATKVDIGVDSLQFQGVFIPKGPITFGNLVDNYPHTESFDEPGWRVVAFKENGARLAILLGAIFSQKNQMDLVFDGLTVENFGVPFFFINGNPLDPLTDYTVAIPSVIYDSVKNLLPSLSGDIFPAATDLFDGQPIFYWPLLEQYVRQNSPLRCLN